MPESIGQKLKAARESRRLTLEKAAEATRVRASYLQALENDDFSVMVSAAQGRGFLRIYADFLGLNLDDLTAGARENKPDASPAFKTDATPPAESTPEMTPASEAKPARPGFWSRLLRRAPTAEVESASIESPAPDPAVTVEEPAAIVAPVEEDAPVKPAKKPARKKPASSEEKSKPVARKAAAGKKKRTMNRPSKK